MTFGYSIVSMAFSFVDIFGLGVDLGLARAARPLLGRAADARVLDCPLWSFFAAKCACMSMGSPDGTLKNSEEMLSR